MLDYQKNNAKYIYLLIVNNFRKNIKEFTKKNKVFKKYEKLKEDLVNGCV